MYDYNKDTKIRNIQKLLPFMERSGKYTARLKKDIRLFQKCHIHLKL